MQAKEAEALRKRKSGKPCDHPHIVKEYDLGADTGDCVCTKCGEARWGRNWNRVDAGEGSTTPRGDDEPR